MSEAGSLVHSARWPNNSAKCPGYCARWPDNSANYLTGCAISPAYSAALRCIVRALRSVPWCSGVLCRCSGLFCGAPVCCVDAPVYSAALRRIVQPLPSVLQRSVVFCGSSGQLGKDFTGIFTIWQLFLLNSL